MGHERYKDEVYQKTNGHCAYCGDKLTVDWHIDHVQPKSRGGKWAVSNFLPACPRCNIRKGSRTPDEFGAFLKEQLRKKLFEIFSDAEEYCKFINRNDAENLLNCWCDLDEFIKYSEIIFFVDTDNG